MDRSINEEDMNRSDISFSSHRSNKSVVVDDNPRDRFSTYCTEEWIGDEEDTRKYIEGFRSHENETLLN